MSDLIFPVTPGTIHVRRTLLEQTTVQAAVAGRELRIGRYGAPRYRYQIEWSFLRGAAAYQEIQRIASFLARHRGKHSSFLFSDPDDNAVTAHGFGYGDGSTTAFQLQRTLGGTAETLTGAYATSTTARRNWVTYSQDPGNAAWVKTSCSVGGTLIAPDGTATSKKLVEAAASAEHYIEQAAAIVDNSPATASAFVKAGERSWVYVAIVLRDGTTVRGVWVNLATGVQGTAESGVTASIRALAGGWYRVAATASVGAGVSNPRLRVKMGTADAQSTYVGDGTSGLHVWGMQFEAAAEVTPYIATTSSATVSVPAYWPASSDGFEPVYEPIWSSVTIYKDDVAQGPVGNWTPGASGIVNFTAAPASGAQLTWTGSFYRRVRFDDDEVDFERIVQDVKKGSIELVSVLP